MSVAEGKKPGPTPLTNAEVLESLETQDVLVPDVGELMNSYRIKFFKRYNRHRLEIQPYFNDMLMRTVPNPEDAKGLGGIDFVLMVSCFFPYANMRELTTVLNCSFWLYLLGEQLKSSNPWKSDYFFKGPDDQPGFVKGAKMDPRQLLNWVEQSVAIDIESENLVEKSPPVEVRNPHVITDIFQDKISKELKGGCYGAQLGLFLEELEYFMQQAQAEKDAIKNLTIPTMAEYRAMRRGVCTGISGVGVLLSLVHYVARLRIHRKITDVPIVQNLWNEVTEILMLSNDLMVWPFKTGQDLFLNAITVHLKESGGMRVQTAADEMFGKLRQSISRFEQFAVELERERREYSLTKENVVTIVDGFRNVFVGNYRWMKLQSKFDFTVGDSDVED